MMSSATHACLFKVLVEKKDVFFILLTDDGSVRGFENLRRGLDYFEGAYQRALYRGEGYWAGAVLNWITLQPRIFRFDTVPHLKKMFGFKRSGKVAPESLNATGVHETVLRCPDGDVARSVYKRATAPNFGMVKT